MNHPNDWITCSSRSGTRRSIYCPPGNSCQTRMTGNEPQVKFPIGKQINNCGCTQRTFAEDSEWTLATVPSLHTICLEHIADNFTQNPILHKLTDKQKAKVLLRLSTRLPLSITVPFVHDEDYWRRCFSKRWENCDIMDHGNSWKQAFTERHLKELIEQFVPNVTSPETIMDVVLLYRDYVHHLCIEQLLPHIQDSYSPLVNVGTFDSGKKRDMVDWRKAQVKSYDHFDFTLILDKLCCLQELSLTYGVKRCGMNFEWALFTFTEHDCLSLAKALQICKTLSVLRLRRSQVTDERLDVLLEHLRDHPSLLELDLGYNAIGDQGVCSIAQVIGTRLRCLTLCDNRIGRSGAHALALLLTRTCMLHSLDLQLNYLGDAGCQAIAGALAGNSSLVKLCLDANNLTEISATSLSHALAQNTMLQTLSLTSNRLGQVGGKVLQEGMVENGSLLELDLRFTEVGEETEWNVRKVLQGNREHWRILSGLPVS
uniref:T-complex-associated-testis-expressed 1 n=2 Tax=Eptatretus burgeri TaxID=7764 RepID=A0A8C4PYT4_EPTBU